MSGDYYGTRTLEGEMIIAETFWASKYFKWVVIGAAVLLGAGWVGAWQLHTETHTCTLSPSSWGNSDGEVATDCGTFAAQFDPIHFTADLPGLADFPVHAYLDGETAPTITFTTVGWASDVPDLKPNIINWRPAGNTPGSR